MSIQSSTDSSSEGKGLFGNAKEAIGGMLDRFLDIPDSPKEAWKRKALYIIFDLGIVLIAFAMLSAMFGSHANLPFGQAIMYNLHNLSFMNMMTLSMVVAGAGVGLSFFIQDVLPKRAHRTAGKVMAVVTPLLILAGVSALILASGNTAGGGMPYHFNFAKSMTSPYFFIGLLLIPLGFYAAAYGIKAFKEPIPYLRGRPPVKAGNRRPRPLLAQSRRMERDEQIRRDRETEIRRNHEG